MSFFKKYFFVCVLILLVLILVFLKVRYGSTSTQEIKDENFSSNQRDELNRENKQNDQSITQDSGQTKVNNGDSLINENKNIDENSNINQSETDNNEKESDFTDSTDYGYSLQPLLPYQGKYFKIERYLKKYYLEVLVDEGDLAKAEEELKTWIDDNEPFPGETKYIFILK